MAEYVRQNMNPARMSTEAERMLEWINLVLGTFCTGVFVFLWSTSPRPASGDFRGVIVAMWVASLALPFLFVTSGILLFTNRRRAALGFGALVLSVIALSQSSVAFD